MSSIMDLIGPDLSEFSTLEFKFVDTPASADIDQTALNVVTIYMTIRSQMSLIIGPVEPLKSELSAFQKLMNLTLLKLYSIYKYQQSAQNLVKMYATV